MASVLGRPEGSGRWSIRSFVWIAIVILVLTVVVVARAGAPARAASCPALAINWTGATSDDWSDGSNWDTLAAPTTIDNACIPSLAVVTISGSAAVNELASNGDLVVSGAGYLTINGASDLESVLLNGSISVAADTTYAQFSEIGGGATLDAAVGAVLVVDGSVDVTGGTVGVTGAGNIDLRGSFIASAPATISSPDGTFSVGHCGSSAGSCSSGTLDGATHGIDLTGVHTWHTNTQSLGVVTNRDMLTVSAEKQSGSNDYGDISGDFTNLGTMLWEPYTGFGDNSAASLFTNEGSLVVTGRMGYNGFSAPSSFVNNGMIDVRTGGQVNTSGMAWENTGDIIVADGSRVFLYTEQGVDADLVNSGTIVLGTLPLSLDRSLSVEGDFVNTPTGTIVIGISDTEASQQYGRLGIDGTATLDGALEIERRNNYDPPIDETYTIITYGSATGVFASGPDPFFSTSVRATETRVTRYRTTVCPSGATTWVGGDGDFSDPLHWSTGVPNATTDACVDLPVTATVDEAAAVNEFVSNGDLVITGTGDLTVNGASNLESVLLNGSISVAADTTYAEFSEIGGGATLDAAAGAVLAVAGSVDLTGGTISVTGAGNVDLTGAFIASALTTISSPDGAFSVGQCERRCTGGTLDGSTHGIDLTGVLTWRPNAGVRGIVTNHATITLSATGQSPSGDFGELSGDFTNYGTMLWEMSVNFGVGQPLTFVNEGHIDVTGGMRVVGFVGPSSFVNNDTIDVGVGIGISTTGVVWENTGDIVVADGGRVSLITGYGVDADLVNSGTMVLGTHPPYSAPNDRSLSVEGDFTNTSNGTIVVGIAGDVPSELYARIGVDGGASLDGALLVERRNNFDPAIGDAYPVISYSTVTGTFASGPGPFFSAADVGGTGTTVTRILPDASEAASADVPAGGIVETDQAVSPTNPLATSVTTPTGGLVSIVEQSPVPATPPSGYEVLGQEFADISAPTASSSDPLLIRFTLDWSVWSPYETMPENVTVIRNGVLVLDCSDPGGSPAAVPDPCVEARTGSTGTALMIDIRTSMASDWVIVVAKDSDGDGVLDANDLCPNTDVLGTATTDRLKKNRFAVNGDGNFVDKKETLSGFTIHDTAGCDESQIIAEADLGRGHTRFGLSRSALKDWVESTSG